MSDECVAAAVAGAPHLVAEQAELVRRLCTSGDRIQCAIGRAGAGKTTAMAAAARAWEAAGWRVVGTAVKGEAARVLAEGAGIPTETVAWFLARAGAARPPLDGRTVLVVDEASTLSDRDLDALVDLVERTGGALRLVGDPAQHGAVAAGGMFRHLAESHPGRTPELVTMHRTTHPADRAAAAALRDGRVEEALEHLRSAGHLQVVEGEVEFYVEMLRRWWEARKEGRPHPMVDRRHRTRHQLNRLARRLLAAEGVLGPEEVTASGGRAFAAGDEVVARMAARHLHVPGRPAAYVRNGATGVVRSVHRGRRPIGDRLRIEFGGVGIIEVPRAFFDEHDGPRGRRDVGIDHAYAVTSYAVQGSTFAASTSRIDEGSSRSETYADITRGREANQLIVTQAADPLDGERLPEAPPPPLVERVGTRLERSGPERPAIEIDPAAGTANAERDAVIEARRVSRTARHRIDRNLAQRLLIRPEPPHLAHQWDETVAALSRYRNRWRPSGGDGPWEWAVGAPPDNPDAAAQHSSLVAQLEQVSLSVMTAQLRDHGWEKLPEWAQSHLCERAALGHSAIDPAATADLLRRIAQFRHQYGVPDLPEKGGPSASAILGPVPDDPAARARHQLLSAELAQSLSAGRAVARRVA